MSLVHGSFLVAPKSYSDRPCRTILLHTCRLLFFQHNHNFISTRGEPTRNPQQIEDGNPANPCVAALSWGFAANLRFCEVAPSTIASGFSAHPRIRGAVLLIWRNASSWQRYIVSSSTSNNAFPVKPWCILHLKHIVQNILRAERCSNC